MLGAIATASSQLLGVLGGLVQGELCAESLHYLILQVDLLQVLPLNLLPKGSKVILP